MRLLLFAEAGFVKFRVKGVEIPFVKLVGQQPQIFTEPLIVHNLAFAQKTNRVLYVVIIRQPQNIVISGAGFLLP